MPKFDVAIVLHATKYVGQIKAENETDAANQVLRLIDRDKIKIEWGEEVAESASKENVEIKLEAWADKVR